MSTTAPRRPASGVPPQRRRPGRSMPAVRTFRIGDPPRRADGLRIGTVRRPPRGVHKQDWTRQGYFDVWLPTVAPSRALLARLATWDPDRDVTWIRFAAAYERELKRPDARHQIELLAVVACRTRISLGCYCQDESRCHRSTLARIVNDRISSAPA